MLQVNIQAGDVLGFWLMKLGFGGQIAHLPLLYKPGPTPGSFTLIVIANFAPPVMPLKVSVELVICIRLINLKASIALCTDMIVYIYI